MNFFSQITGRFDFSRDWLMVLIFLAIGLGYGLALGKNRINLITVLTYFSLVANKAIPWSEIRFLGAGYQPAESVQIFLFLATILALFFLAPYSALGSVIKMSGRGRARLWQVFILGVFQLGLLVSGVVSFLTPKTVLEFNFLAKFFIGTTANFIWLLLPMLGMLIFKKRRHSLGED